MREKKCNHHFFFLIRPQDTRSTLPRLLGLLNSLAIFVKVNPLPSLLINELRPLAILGNQSLVQFRIVGHPTLLTDDVGNRLALRFEDFLNLGTGFKSKVLAFDYERWLGKLVKRRG